MSKPVLRDLFKFEGRRNRKSFVLYFVVIFLAYTFLGTVITVIFPSSTVLALGIVGIPFLVSILAIYSQRLRDLNHSGWWALLYFIPIVGGILIIYILFKSGTPSENQYGEDPLSDDVWYR